MPLSVGQHTATVSFLNANGTPLPQMTKTITLNVTSTDHDQVVFVSDSSVTPQTL